MSKQIFEEWFIFQFLKETAEACKKTVTSGLIPLAQEAPVPGRQRKENDLRNLGGRENVWLPYLCL